MTRIQTLRRAAYATIALAAAHLAAPAAAHAQATLYACYVPSTGSTYRIRTADTPAACTKSTHVQFSWVDGADAVRIPYATTVNTGTTLLSLQNNGSGLAGQFLANSATGVFARSLGGTALHAVTFAGPTQGAAIKAEATGTYGTALEIKSGAFRVTGAGVNTPTAAFRVLTSCQAKVLDHPMLNGDAKALVFLSANDATTGGGVLTAYASYNNATARWEIRTNDSPVGGYCIERFVNVLVIKSN